MSDTIRFKYKEYCVYCGKEVSGQYDDWQKYYECDCADVIHNKGINDVISNLRKQLIKPKYEKMQEEKLVLIKE